MVEMSQPKSTSRGTTLSGLSRTCRKLPPLSSGLVIENVGNLVCPTSWDLGESLRVVLMSVTEGEEKPLKYPGLFNTADLVVITKIDFAEACRFDRAAAMAAIEQVRPGVTVLETSVVTGEGVDAWLAEIAPKN